MIMELTYTKVGDYCIVPFIFSISRYPVLPSATVETDRIVMLNISGTILYYIPALVLDDDAKYEIGMYGRMRERFLEEHRPSVYNRMILFGEL